MPAKTVTPDAARDAAEIEMFKEFLRINTMHPNPDLGACVAWLKKQADALGFAFQVCTFHEGLPVVVASKIGTEPHLPSVALNCHMDVVPIVPEMWTALPPGETPFSAWEDESNGFIYARGAQDMKCVGAEFMCALQRMKDMTFKRTVHTIWVPDEEIGGVRGMKCFVESDAFKALNIGVTMDEGLAHDENAFVVHYGERTPLWIGFTAGGVVGHAAKLLENTAMDRLARVVGKMTARRDVSVATMSADKDKLLGDVTSVNWTMAKAGMSTDGGKTYAYNVIPATAEVVFDCRVTFDDFPVLLAEAEALAKEYDLKLSFPAGRPDVATPYSPLNTMWYRTIAASIGQWGASVRPAIFPAATDSRYLRKVGIPAFGFSPMRNMPSLLHDHNEYLPRAAFLEGVAVYEDLIEQLANVPAQPAESKL
jgi:aminoacylase